MGIKQGTRLVVREKQFIQAEDPNRARIRAWKFLQDFETACNEAIDYQKLECVQSLFGEPVKPFDYFQTGLYVDFSTGEDLVLYGKIPLEEQLISFQKELALYRKLKIDMEFPPSLFLGQKGNKLLKGMGLRHSLLAYDPNVRCISVPFGYIHPEDDSHWRNDPSTRHQFSLPKYPDDLPVVVFDSDYYLTGTKPEMIWCRTVARNGPFFLGKVLNDPKQLRSIKKTMWVCYTIANGSKHAVMLPLQYLYERDQWIIDPCTKCGFKELFIAPSVLQERQFKGVAVAMMTGRCGMCGGTQVIQKKGVMG